MKPTGRLGDITYPVPPPAIQSFVADSPTITEGESNTLSWEVSGIATVTITLGIGRVDPSGDPGYISQ